MPTPRKALVFGPAYIDRVLLVDRPLVNPTLGRTIDRSVTGEWVDMSFPFESILITGLAEGDTEIEPPPGWPGPTGFISAGDEPNVGDSPELLSVRGVDWHDDLGGMGPGFASALGGTLRLLVGDDSDPIRARVLDRLRAAGIAHRPTVVPGRLGEWTLLVTSGEHGDKLAIGFRDGSPADFAADPVDDGPCDLLVAASMTNRRAAWALERIDARVKLFAPALRNMADLDPKVSAFARHIDILSCNAVEWATLADREEVAWRVSILAVTDGPRGATVRYTNPVGDAGLLTIPAFPRRRPPVDTNRAGEAFAAALTTALLDAGWTPGPAADDLVRLAATRASAASALVLDRADFGFPTAEEVDRALRDGIV